MFLYSVLFRSRTYSVWTSEFDPFLALAEIAEAFSYDVLQIVDARYYPDDDISGEFVAYTMFDTIV